MADRMAELKEKGWTKLTKEERDEYRALKGGTEEETTDEDETVENENADSVEDETEEVESDDLGDTEEEKEEEQPKKEEEKKQKNNSNKPTRFTGIDNKAVEASAVFTKYTFAKNTKFQGQIYEIGQRLPDCSPEDVKMLLDAKLITL